MSYHLHMPTCWDCKFSQCPEPAGPHSWGDAEDFAHAQRYRTELPGLCACECAHRPPRVTVYLDREALKVMRKYFPGRRMRPWRWECPGCDKGTASNGVDALALGISHRWGGNCKHRKVQA